MKLERSKWILSHTMPAFVGGQHSNDWRIPSFKGALRYWWRVAVSAQHPGWRDHKPLLEREGHLFGQVLSDQGASKSRVRLAFDAQDKPLSKQPWPATGFGRVGEGGKQAPADLYLGYGAIVGTRNPAPKKERWIDPNVNATLLLQTPPDALAEVELALAALHHLGGLGNRSRRGWGSAKILNSSGDAPMSLRQLLKGCSVDLSVALQRDWPNGIVADDRGPLIWQSEPITSWQRCVTELAVMLKAANKTMLGIERAESKKSLITLGSGGDRWPSLLRFKVAADNDGLRLRVIFIPFKTPKEIRRELTKELCFELIGLLDTNQKLTRINADTQS
jgi:CRISPR-associated protein Cmr1